MQNTNKGLRDVFITKFDPEGAMVFSTYLGGSGDDVGNAIAVDSDGNIYITGRTTSTDFPLKEPMQEKNSGGWDVFIAKIDADGKGIVYSTYLGGNDYDEGRGITIDR